jgi:hypothetical protein
MVLRQELLKRHDAARQELLKELVAAKAGIETGGLAVADLRNSEKQVRAPRFGIEQPQRSTKAGCR